MIQGLDHSFLDFLILHRCDLDPESNIVIITRDPDDKIKNPRPRPITVDPRTMEILEWAEGLEEI